VCPAHPAGVGALGFAFCVDVVPLVGVGGLATVGGNFGGLGGAHGVVWCGVVVVVVVSFSPRAGSGRTERNPRPMYRGAGFRVQIATGTLNTVPNG